MRGGTSQYQLRATFVTGLSPHARGNLRNTVSPHSLVGPIPACAGEPSHEFFLAVMGRAYPRMRGGTALILSSLWPWLGLSPHARGNHLLPMNRKRPGGPIPACAGEPPDMAPYITLTGAYPRMRGGTRLAFPQPG